MDDRSWFCRWLIPQPRRDHHAEIAAELARQADLDERMAAKARELDRIMHDMTERKRGRNDA